jgi:hypothetical protein
MPSESEERDGCGNTADSKRVHLRKQKRQKEASPQFPFGGDVSNVLPLRSSVHAFRATGCVPESGGMERIHALRVLHP